MRTNALERVLRETDDFAGARHLVDVEGMSSPKVCNLLNRLVSAMDPDEHYLEIGTWKGRTLLSAAAGNHHRLCIGCDKFRFFGRYTGWGHVARRAFANNVARYREERARILFYEMSSRRLLRSGRVPRPIGVFFYDGDHSYAGTRWSIRAVARLLSPRSVLVVDDWNVRRIRLATRDAIADARLKVLWNRWLEGDHTENTWWNGLGVFYVEASPRVAPARSVARVS
jgi:hypothetical protein